MASLIIQKGGSFENLFQLQGNIRIGRDQNNDIILQSVDISRVHATIERGEGDQYILFDKSQNGTWMNGKKIQREILTHDMSFVISDYQFYFKEEISEDTNRLVIDDTTDSESEQISLEETHLFSPEITPFSKVIKGISKAEISFLDRIHELVDIIDYQELIGKILDLSLEMFPIDVAYLALRQNPRDNLITIDRKSRLGKANIPFKVSQSIIQKVIKSGRPVLIRDTQKENPSASIMTIGAKTVACIPLKRRKETIGCLYIDNRRQSDILSNKDIDLLQFLCFLIAVAVENSRLLRPARFGAAGCRGNLMDEKPVYESELMRDLFSKAYHCAPSPYSVLIRGEAGTGKDLLARAIHTYSGRNDNKYVALNCAMIPSDLLESELFGAKKGAFTGATTDHQGKIEAAAGGTLFLDEIGDLRLDLQPKLLRFLENKTFYRLGENRERHANVRIIAATNRDLKAMVQNNQFRQDLYDRLNTIPLHVPPLRERKEDIPPLVNHFSRKCASENEREPFNFSENSLGIMKKYHWPGNVRELLNLVRRVAVWIPEQRIRKKRLLEEWNISKGTHEITGRRILKLEDVEKQHILFALSQNDWNVAKTARALAIARDTLNRKIKKFQIKKSK